MIACAIRVRWRRQDEERQEAGRGEESSHDSEPTVCGVQVHQTETAIPRSWACPECAVQSPGRASAAEAAFQACRRVRIDLPDQMLRPHERDAGPRQQELRDVASPGRKRPVLAEGFEHPAGQLRDEAPGQDGAETDESERQPRRAGSRGAVRPQLRPVGLDVSRAAKAEGTAPDALVADAIRLYLNLGPVGVARARDFLRRRSEAA